VEDFLEEECLEERIEKLEERIKEYPGNLRNPRSLRNPGNPENKRYPRI
jgi:hypothetical protein